MHVRRVVLHGRHEDTDGYGHAGHTSSGSSRKTTTTTLVSNVAQLVVTHEAIGVELETSAIGLLRVAAAVVGAARNEHLARIKHGCAHEATTLQYKRTAMLIRLCSKSNMTSTSDNQKTLQICTTNGGH